MRNIRNASSEKRIDELEAEVEALTARLAALERKAGP